MTARKLLVPSLLLLLAATPASAQLQGTLFTNPEQRDYLDFLREEHLARSRERGFDINEVIIPDLPAETVAPPPEPVIYRLGGIMSRQDGSHSIWLNGRSLDESSLPGGATLVRENGTLALRFVTSGGAVFLRPGQTLNFDRGVVLENYQSNGAPAADTKQAQDPAPDVPAAETTPAPAENTRAADTTGTDAPQPDTSDLPNAEQLQALATEMNMNPETLQALLQQMQAAAARVATENGDVPE